MSRHCHLYPYLVRIRVPLVVFVYFQLHCMTNCYWQRNNKASRQPLSPPYVWTRRHLGFEKDPVKRSTLARLQSKSLHQRAGDSEEARGADRPLQIPPLPRGLPEQPVSQEASQNAAYLPVCGSIAPVGSRRSTELVRRTRLVPFHGEGCRVM